MKDHPKIILDLVNNGANRISVRGSAESDLCVATYHNSHKVLANFRPDGPLRRDYSNYQGVLFNAAYLGDIKTLSILRSIISSTEGSSITGGQKSAAERLVKYRRDWNETWAHEQACDPDDDREERFTAFEDMMANFAEVDFTTTKEATDGNDIPTRPGTYRECTGEENEAEANKHQG